MKVDQFLYLDMRRTYDILSKQNHALIVDKEYWSDQIKRDGV